MTGLAAQIRPALPGDAAAVAQVHVETWRTTYAGVVPDDYLLGLREANQRRSWRQQIAARAWPGSVLVAEAPGAGKRSIVGFGSCGALRGGALQYEAEIYTLYVSSDWQGEGIGRGLLTGLFQSALSAGLRSAMLWVLSRNPSRYFYEAMGGEQVGERKERFAGSWLEESAYGWANLRQWLDRAR